MSQEQVSNLTQFNTFKVLKKNELTLGMKNIRPYSDLYHDSTGILAPKTREAVNTGILEIVLENVSDETTTAPKIDTASLSTSVVFHILGNNPTEENKYIETHSKFVGLNTPIDVEQTNHFHLEHKYTKDEMFGHIVGFKCFSGEFENVESLDDTVRGKGGLGSTGTK